MYQNCKPCSINPDRDSSPANSTSLVESPLAEDKIECRVLGKSLTLKLNKLFIRL